MLQVNTRTIFFFLLLLALVPYFYISMYCHPIADDFTYAFKGQQLAFFQTYLSEYFHWNGRYISNLFVLLNPIAYNSFLIYKLIPVLIICLTVFSIYFCLNVFVNRCLNKINTLIISIVLTLVFLHKMPIVSEGIYWYTGAVTYQLGNVFFLIYAGFVFMFLQEFFVLKSKLIHLIGILFLMFITIGFNEIIMLYMCLFTVIVSLIMFMQTSQRKIPVLLILSVFVCSCIVYFSPGNSVRSDYFSTNHQFFYSLKSSLLQVVRFFFDWTSQLPLLFLSILYYPLNKKLSKSILLFNNSFYMKPYMSLILLLLIIFLGVFPAYWATGLLGQHRTMNTAYFVFIFVWFLNLTVWYNAYLLNSSIVLKSKVLKNTLYACIIGALMFSYNGYTLLEDILKNRVKDFDMQMSSRYSIITHSTDTIFFKPIVNIPKTLFVLDITDNHKNWQNEGYAIFFNKRGVPVVLMEP